MPSASFLSFLVLFALSTFVLASPFDILPRALPNVPDGTTGRSLLAKLKVESPSNKPAYSRSRFKTWDIFDGGCNTRQMVLLRDGTNTKKGNKCRVTGTWVSPYDGVTIKDPGKLDIDHIVPLKEAWESGARLWTDAEREKFANDLQNPQLVAVSFHENRKKGDSDPATYLPPLKSFQCTYVLAYVKVKSVYNLSIDAAEKTALERTLAPC